MDKLSGVEAIRARRAATIRTDELLEQWYIDAKLPGAEYKAIRDAINAEYTALEDERYSEEDDLGAVIDTLLAAHDALAQEVARLTAALESISALQHEWASGWGETVNDERDGYSDLLDEARRIAARALQAPDEGG